MSFQIETAHVQAYHANINLLSQQMGSRLAGNVRRETQSAKYDYYDRVDATAAVEVTTRHGDTPLVSTTHDRRRVGLRDFDWADLIDKRDRIRLLSDPSAAYTLNALAALGRSKDQVIIDAAFGTAYTGETGASSVSSGWGEVAVDYVESGGVTASNLTIGKLRQARSILGRNEAISQVMGGDGQLVDEPLIAVVKQYQLDSLLRSPEITSGDFNVVKALVDGKVDTFMGFKFKRTELLSTTANVTDCIFYAQSGILLATGMEVATDIGPRRDKRNAVQVYVCGSFGAVRMEEKKVVRVKCNDTL